MSQRSAYTPLRVLVYSDNGATRARVTQALGRRPDRSLPPIEIIETATAPVLLQHVGSTSLDLVILDGEASPAGGLGLAKQLKDELLQCPPVVVLTGRADDGWLTRWARVDDVVAHPIDPVALTNAIVPLLRSRLIA